MIHVGKYTIHGFYGLGDCYFQLGHVANGAGVSSLIPLQDPKVADSTKAVSVWSSRSGCFWFP